MRIGHFGDYHTTRSLPYSGTDEQGRDIRYEYRKDLLKKVIEPFDLTFHYGDLTDKKNYIDGKIMQDHYEIFKDKKTIHILGNHDRSADGNKYCSMVEMLAEVIPGMHVVTDVETIEIDNVIYVCTSYYANEADIKMAVTEAIEHQKDNRQVVVVGHWNFYNDLWNSGKKLNQFAYEMAPQVKWLLGHEHNPNEINISGKFIGYYLGCFNPNRFSEKQGNVIVFDDGKPEVISYPEGEQFIVASTNDKINITNPELTYLRLVTHDLEEAEKWTEKYQDLAHFSVKYEPITKEEAEEIKERAEIKSIEDYLAEACNELEFDEDEIGPYHQRVKRICEGE